MRLTNGILLILQLLLLPPLQLPVLQPVRHLRALLLQALLVPLQARVQAQQLRCNMI